MRFFFLSECIDARWGEELPWESCSINSSLCVIRDLSLIAEGGREGGGRAESEIDGHRE